MKSHKVEKSKSSLEEKEEKERLRLIRKKWCIQRELERKHEARKIRKIEEYERRRAEELKIDKQISLRRSKSNSPQRRTTDYKYPEKLKISPSKYEENTIINKKELRKIKVNIYIERVCQRSQNISKNEIERHIDNLNDIVLPRRKDEGSRPIFKNIKAAEDKTRTTRFLRDNKLEKQLSDKERIDTCKSTSFDISKTDTQYRSIRHPHDRRDDKYPDNSPTKRSLEDRSRNERKNRSSSHCDSGTASTFRDRSSSRRSRSNSSSNKVEERKQDYDKDKFSSRRNRSREPNVRSSLHSELATNCSPSYGSYDTCMRFPGSMYRIQAPPMIWPIAPGLFPVPFPPSMRWRSLHPPRFPNYNVSRGFYRGPR